MRRFRHADGFLADVIFDEDAGIPAEPEMVDPLDHTRRRVIPEGTPFEDLLVPVLRGGAPVWQAPPLAEARARSAAQLARFHAGVKRPVHPPAYPVGLERDFCLPRGGRNPALIESLLSSDALVVAGQAASHCVKATVEDLLREIQARDPRLAGRVYLLEDCMSSVAVPDGKGGFLSDFTPEAEAALGRFAEAGMNVVRSTTPIGEWPGMGMK